jgi:glucose-1-phosphate adenylyltransferase
VVEAGASISGSVVGAGVRVRKGAQVHTSILDEGVDVERRAVVGSPPRRRRAAADEITLIGMDSVIAARQTIPAGARLEPGTTAR